ncbi:carboxypeptidase regulatory-like domain-containing protein [Chryseosolibacter indicus]|uniref:Carboxypeptidase regulatory-like domain-containing protein n=1 Tax=Chryseosolibacter indicus TaxID=2782351 RepID=A0ABS5VMN0_9BACT|nr:carboxypeptidase regulatory-like domain-containing protein [Chryseosolibacter indicus]MBT1702371.1 carboxypeptidase regulatory-like domain-containing protein [Chryseosolibacter indicus]
MKLLAITLFAMLTITLDAAAQKQGIKGNIVWVTGNQMPGPNKKTEKGKGVEREILFYKPVSLEHTKQRSGFFTEIEGTLVAKVKSNANGFFCVKLPEGEYSMFTQEPEGLFANLFDDQRRINVIAVRKKKFTEVTFQVNYSAAY